MSKNFTDKMKSKAAENPAMMFISQPEKPQAAEETRTPGKRTRKAETSPLQAEKAPIIPAARPTAPRKEFKSRRLQLLIQPSLYEEIRSRAEAEGLSVNEEIHNLLRQALGE